MKNPNNSSPPGTLFIIATPIGNLADLSQRALDTLRQVDLIAAEDTRHSSQLLRHYGITTPTISLHQHNEAQRGQTLLTQLQQGKQIALISDAGTPLISDPGYRLVRLLAEHQIPLIPIPGACAAIAALICSGLPTDHFVFEGFLPTPTQQQRQRLTELVEEPRTMIFYEATHRLESTLTNFIQIFGGDRPAAIAKELTKKFEQIHRAPLAELPAWLAADPHRHKGEFVLVVGGAPAKKDSLDTKTLQILELLAAKLPTKDAVTLTAQITGAKRRTLYQSWIGRMNELSKGS